MERTGKKKGLVILLGALAVLSVLAVVLLGRYKVVGRITGPEWDYLEMDGVTYMFDPQLEWRYLYDYGRGGYDLFMFRPGQVRFLYLR